MKIIIALLSVLMSLVGLVVSVINCFAGQYFIGLLLGVWFYVVTERVGIWLWKELKPRKVFTLMELLAVITIMSILLTIMIRVFKIDYSKSDAIRLSSELKLLHSQSMVYDNDYGYERPFVLEPSDYPSKITLSHPDLVFKKGEPSINPTEQYTIEVSYKDMEPFIIYVRPFTGKVTFY